MKDNKIKNNKLLPSKYKFIKRKIICSNSKFDILFDHIISPENEEIEDFLIVKPKIRSKNNIIGICVLPMIDGNFYLMRGWRHQFKELIYQAPAGFIEKGESPFQSALRELQEETSLICKPENLISLGSFIPDAGLIEGNVSLFLAKVLASNNAWVIELGLAIFLPAKLKAVPWAGEVLTIGSPAVKLTPEPFAIDLKGIKP